MNPVQASLSLAFALTLLNLLGGAANAQNLEPQAYDSDVLHVAEHQGRAQEKALRLLLISPPKDGRNFYDSVFYYETRLRTALRALVRDPKAGAHAVDLLTLIAEPEDVRFVIQHPPRLRNQILSRWAYDVACSLLDPSTEEEWSFLRNSALRNYQYIWIDRGAIQTLKLIASPRSRELLEEAQRLNQATAPAVAQALDYIQSAPLPLTGPDLYDLAARVAQTIKIGNWQGNGNPRYNEARDKALINFTFSYGRDVLIYTATFYRTQSLWRLRGAREVAQLLGERPPPQVPGR